MSVLRVGSVPYLVARPLDLGLDGEPGIDLVRAVPARLASMLRAQEVDVALVSSIELFRIAGARFLDGLAVAGRGFVSSVQVFLRRPVEEIETVALDPASRTAAALVQVVLDPSFPGSPRAVAPRFVDVPEGRAEGRHGSRFPDADAWLRIGDAALRTHLAPDAPPVFNPSEAWTRGTGLLFPFATWLVRPGVEPTPRALEAFVRARARGRTAVERLARHAAETWALPPEGCRRYLVEECLYEPGAELRPALRAFRDHAAARGLCDAELDPRPIALPEVPCPRA